MYKKKISQLNSLIYLPSKFLFSRNYYHYLCRYACIMNFTNFNYCDPSSPLKEGCDSFYLTKTASYTATGTSTVSIISSMSILYIVARSAQKLRSTYHRIMTNIAIFDLVGSLAMSLSTIPMPKDVIYPFEGGRVYGNIETCEAQAFLILFGCIGSLLMFWGLQIFYVSIIQFNISDKVLRRYLEPAIHICAWLSASVVPVSIKDHVICTCHHSRHTTTNIAILTVSNQKCTFTVYDS